MIKFAIYLWEKQSTKVLYTFILLSAFSLVGFLSVLNNKTLSLTGQLKAHATTISINCL